MPDHALSTADSVVNFHARPPVPIHKPGMPGFNPANGPSGPNMAMANGPPNYNPANGPGADFPLPPGPWMMHKPGERRVQRWWLLAIFLVV